MSRVHDLIRGAPELSSLSLECSAGTGEREFAFFIICAAVGGASGRTHAYAYLLTGSIF
jgi:hypothetical protein